MCTKEVRMNEEGPTRTERLEMHADQLVGRVKQLIHEGNVRRITVRQGEDTIASFPLTAGVVGAVLAPALAAIGALAALLTECTVEIERVEGATSTSEPTEPAPPTA
jgi:hypothetical protein